MSLLTSPTLQTLLTDVRVMLNQLDPNNSFWKDDELTNYLNQGVRLYFVEAVKSGVGQFSTVVDLDITSGADTISLPSDFFEMRNLWRKVSNGYETLTFRNIGSDNYSTTAGTGGNNYMPYYYFRGNAIVLRPPPVFSETAALRMEYIQFPDTMIYGGDMLTAQVSPIFKELITMYAVYKGKLKESLVSNVNVHKNAEESVAALFTAFKDAITKRTMYPTFIEPFNPENY